MKILLAEDDKNLGKLLTALLRKNRITVDWVENGSEAAARCYRDSYDVLVLDWMMPLMSGIDLCRKLREEEYQGKILMLTARDSVDDRVKGLNSGADDYLVKPFMAEELVARLSALVRKQGVYQTERIEYKGFILDENDYSLSYENKKIELRPREFQLLEVLMRNKGSIIPRDVLQERVWGIDSYVSENNLDVHIRFLRKKITNLCDIKRDWIMLAI